MIEKPDRRNLILLWFIPISLTVLFSGCAGLNEALDTASAIDHMGKHDFVHQGVVERIQHNQNGGAVVYFKDGNSYEVLDVKNVTLGLTYIIIKNEKGFEATK